MIVPVQLELLKKRGRKPASVKLPSAPDVALKLKPLLVSLATTLAPGRPPVSSFTSPRMVALVDCARLATEVATTRAEATKSDRGRRGRDIGDLRKALSQKRKVQETLSPFREEGQGPEAKLSEAAWFRAWALVPRSPAGR
jgi:hypothetical protein